MFFEKFSLTLFVIKLSKILGLTIFQFPSNNFKLSSLGVSFLILRVLFNATEIVLTFEVDSGFYFGPSEVLNTVSYVNLVIYGTHLFLVSFFNVLFCKKIFELFREIEIIEKEVNFIFFDTLL